MVAPAPAKQDRLGLDATFKVNGHRLEVLTPEYIAEVLAELPVRRRSRLPATNSDDDEGRRAEADDRASDGDGDGDDVDGDHPSTSVKVYRGGKRVQAPAPRTAPRCSALAKELRLFFHDLPANFLVSPDVDYDHTDNEEARILCVNALINDKGRLHRVRRAVLEREASTTKRFLQALFDQSKSVDQLQKELDLAFTKFIKYLIYQSYAPCRLCLCLSLLFFLSAVL